MKNILKRTLAWTLIACLPLVISACGGGGGGGGGAGASTTISGNAFVKGPIQGAVVQVYQLLPGGGAGELLGSGTTGAAGNYAVQIPTVRAGGPLLVKVTGQQGATYISEAGGVVIPFTAGQSLTAVISAVSPGQSITVSPLTEAGYQQLQQILTINPSLASDSLIGGAVNAANNRIATLFGTGSVLANPSGDLMYQAALLVIDRMIVQGGASATITTVMNLIDQAIADVTKPAYQTFQQAFTVAATSLKAANSGNPQLIAALDALIARIGNPAAAPDWKDITQPTAPSNLTAVTIPINATLGSIALSWTPSTDNTAVAGYEIFRDDVKIATVTTPGYTDASLATNATYKYYVFAFDAVGNRSVASNQLLVPLGVAISDTTPPTAPANLSAATFLTDTTASVVLMWSPSTDNKAVVGYDVYRDGAKITSVASPGYTDPSVAVAGSYTYYVVAFDGAGNRSAASASLSVTPNRPSLGVTVNGQLSTGGFPQTDSVAPTAPTNLAASTFAQTSTTSSVVLSWSASSDNIAVTGYEVYRNGSRIATVTTPGYTDPSVTSTITYTYFIIAVDAAGNRSAASNQLMVTPNVPSLGVTVNGQLSPGITGQPQTDVTAPTAPSNLTASTAAVSATTSSVLLAWSPSSDDAAVIGYEVYRNGTKIATASLLGYTDPSVTSNVTYSYYVVAFDAAGNRSAASNQLSVTPNQPSLGVTVTGQLSTGITGQPQVDVTAPTAPTGLTASTSALSATTSSVQLAWAPSADNSAVTGYDVYRNGTKIATVSLLGYTDPSVTSNVTYSYYVVAFDAAGNRSAASSQLLVTPNQASLGVTVNGQLSTGVTGLPQVDAVAPTAPSNLTASTSAVSATTSSVLLAWSPSSDNTAVAGYEVYRNGAKIATVTTPAYNDPSVLSNVTYSYYVKAFDATGNRSAASNQLSVTPNQASLGVTVGGQISTGGLPQVDVTPPTAPANLTATTTAVSATTSSVTLAWSPSSDDTAVAGYEVYRNGSKIATVAAPGYTDASVTANVTYTYAVKAFDAAGNRSGISNQLLVTPTGASLGITVNGQLSSSILGF